ncbi:MAG TPA: hypothetical protein DCX06_04980 [Opitutae bacterium]|nr:hypothetical protein [Opitutae bacterium]
MFFEFLKKRWVDVTICSVILIGIIWRLGFYFWDVSLWHDEILLANSIIDRGYLELLRPLEYGQVAPHVFLFAVEASTRLFGESEWSLRLIPMLSGCLALVWMGYYARRYLDPVVAIFVCSLMSFSTSLMMYTVNFKQYSGDLLASVVALHLFTLVQDSKRWCIGASGLVLLLPWMSFPSIFVIAGLTIGFLFNALFDRDQRQFARIAVVGGVGAISFSIYYFLILANISSSEDLVDFWVHFYFWEPLWSYRNYLLLNSGIMYTTTFYYGLTMWVFVAGLVLGLWRNYRQILPCMCVFAVTLIVVYLQKYPFCERLILFLFPFSAIIVSQIVALIPRTKMILVVVSVASALSMFLHSYQSNVSYLLNGPVYQDVRSNFDFIESNGAPDEIICLVPPFDEFSKFYSDYPALSEAVVLGDLSELTLLPMVESAKPIWVVSEERRADQSQFLIDLVYEFNQLAESLGRGDYELSYVKFKRTIMIYFEPAVGVDTL